MTHTSLTDELRDRAVSYALGTLTADEALAFEEHLEEGCTACRREVESYREVVGGIGLAAAPVRPDRRVRDKVLSRIRSGESSETPRMTFVLEREGDWQEVQPGVHRKELGRGVGPQNTGYLIRLDPGTRAAAHDHAVSEHCYIVSGDLFIGGRWLEEGDYHLALPGSSHDVVETKQGCLLLVLEVAA